MPSFPVDGHICDDANLVFVILYYIIYEKMLLISQLLCSE